MSTPLARVEYGKIFDNYERNLRRLQSEALKESGGVLKRHLETSMRARWYRTGASVESINEGEVTTEGNKAQFTLTVGTFYSIFGEYGTGQRGAATGQPAPPFYKYGSKLGMSARRFSRLAIETARSEIHDLHLLKLRELGKGMTVAR
jgi:hypothetical protein